MNRKTIALNSEVKQTVSDHGFPRGVENLQITNRLDNYKQTRRNPHGTLVVRMACRNSAEHLAFRLENAGESMANYHGSGSN